MLMALLLLTVAADPFLNDATFIVSVLSLEELGATGNKVGPLLHLSCAFAINKYLFI